MSCWQPPIPPNSQGYGSVSLLLSGLDLFHPFEGANQPQKKHIVIGGAEVLGLEDLRVRGSNAMTSTRWIGETSGFAYETYSFTHWK